MIATRILSEGGRAVGLELAETAKGFTRDDQGRRQPKVKPGTEISISVDTVIVTVGQFSDLRFLDERFDELSVDLKTLTSDIEGLFVVAGRKTGASFIIEAVALGHRVAGSIHRFLQQEPLQDKAVASAPVVKFRRQELQKRVESGDIAKNRTTITAH
jgi:NADPH-dependent glutamate synthase beta subunit-like oxidoreductase